MIIVGLLVIFAVLGVILAIVAYSSNQRKRAGQNPVGNQTDSATVARASSPLN